MHTCMYVTHVCMYVNIYVHALVCVLTYMYSSTPTLCTSRNYTENCEWTQMQGRYDSRLTSMSMSEQTQQMGRSNCLGSSCHGPKTSLGSKL